MRRRSKKTKLHASQFFSASNPNPVAPAATALERNIIPLCAISLKSLFLQDWWLAKPHGKGLAVEGLEPHGKQVRAFTSAAIAKRFHTTCLETLDGIRVTIGGLINRSRTLQNGFPAEICSHFLFGFPHDWEKYTTWFDTEESAAKAEKTKTSHGVELNMSSGSGTSFPSPASMRDLPVTMIRDILMSPIGDDENFVREFFEDMLENTPAQDHSPTSFHSNRQDDRSDIAANREISSKAEKVKVAEIFTGEDGALDPRHVKREDQKSQPTIDLDFLSHIKGATADQPSKPSSILDHSNRQNGGSDVAAKSANVANLSNRDEKVSVTDIFRAEVGGSYPRHPKGEEAKEDCQFKLNRKFQLSRRRYNTRQASKQASNISPINSK